MNLNDTKANLDKLRYSLLPKAMKDALKAARLRVGPGIGLQATPAGKSITLSKPPFANPANSVSQEDDAGSPKALGFTQGTQDTDTYDRDTDGGAVQYSVITDIQYDPNTLVLSCRYRTIVETRVDTISAESDLVTITTAEVCT